MTKKKELWGISPLVEWVRIAKLRNALMRIYLEKEELEILKTKKKKGKKK